MGQGRAGRVASSQHCSGRSSGAWKTGLPASCPPSAQHLPAASPREQWPLLSSAISPRAPSQFSWPHSFRLDKVHDEFNFHCYPANDRITFWVWFSDISTLQLQEIKGSFRTVLKTFWFSDYSGEFWRLSFCKLQCYVSSQLHGLCHQTFY